jgi:hypothetical protein
MTTCAICGDDATLNHRWCLAEANLPEAVLAVEDENLTIVEESK